MVTAQAKQSIAAARRDLAFRAGCTEHEIIVAEVKAVEWRDQSLGRVAPVGGYQQQPTAGYRLVLVAVSREYEYHADENGNVVYCGRRRQG